MNVPPGFWEAIASWPATGPGRSGEEVMPPLQPMAGDGPHRCPQAGAVGHLLATRLYGRVATARPGSIVLGG
jgi:hypothetical protein